MPAACNWVNEHCGDLFYSQRVCVLVAEGFLSKRFKYVYAQLYSDSHFVWYRSQYSSKPEGLVFLAVR